MIEEKEIRIGNWFTHNSEWSHRNDGKLMKRPFSFCWESYDWYCLAECMLSLEQITPIPLTRELLIKNGFTEDNSVHLWLNLQTHYLELITAMDGYYPVYVQVPEMSSENEQRVSLTRINYVHQLQNLIYALTGEELTVSL